MRLATRNGLCSGCRACLALCSAQNTGHTNPKKAALKVIAHFPVPGNYEVKVCDQCGVCAGICPVGAIVLKDSVYCIDPDQCTGCYGCVEACPNGVLVTHKDQTHPIKCTGCGECIDYCPRRVIYDQEKGAE